MTQFFKFSLVILFCSLISCNENSTEKKAVKNDTKLSVKGDLKKAQDEILKLPEVIIKNKMIDSLSNHKHGISLLSDSSTIDGTEYFEIKAGYNSDLRYETYYNFYVEKGNCKNIKIAEPIEGDIIPISEWRNRNQNRKGKPFNLENWPYKSFVISCGSGCAMTYSAVEINRNTQNIKGKFKVDQHIDEIVTETFEEDFTFIYDSSNRLKTIKRKDDNENFLGSQSSSSQESFKKFAADLIKFTEKDAINKATNSKNIKKLSLPVKGNEIDILDYPTSD